MGKGGNAARDPRERQGLAYRIKSFDNLSSAAVQHFKNDLSVLKTIWFQRTTGNTHASRLEAFYAGQASHYDKFRSNFLWGRKPLLAALAARLRQQDNLIWVDLGGGTGANVEMMLELLPISQFAAIYIVDLCPSLCAEARKKVQAKGWSKVVHVVEEDACTFSPKQQATCVTFSYSLSMIPPFHAAIDRAITYLHPTKGLMGVCDFYVSSKYDLPLRQMSSLKRFFWRAVFDTDGIDLGPERRQFLDHQLSRLWEINSQGSIPYVPFLKASYYCWIGHVPQLATVLSENKVEAPPLFPPTFLYNSSWEDPAKDMEALELKEDDVCLTLTSGGCNALNLCLQGVASVTAVDCNPAQSALLELKATVIRKLPFSDAWALFGDGRHPAAEHLYETRLAPFLTQSSTSFWNSRLQYFKSGLYIQGGMGQIVWILSWLLWMLRLGPVAVRIATAPSLEVQRREWDAAWPVRFLRSGPRWLVHFVVTLISWICFNPAVLWFGGGVPRKQMELIHADGSSIAAYIGRTLDGVAHNSHLRTENYFYYSCLMGRFARDNCPSFLRQDNFEILKASNLDQLSIFSGTFMEALSQRTYTKVILMDHVDWLIDPDGKDTRYARELASALAKQVAPGGRVIWRSAALEPPYAAIIAAAGFDVLRLQHAEEGFMDRVNMYASFYVAIRHRRAE